MSKEKTWWNDRTLFAYHFARSNYITAITDWFMGFAGKWAELVLYGTVLYSCAQLYPGVYLPVGLSLAVFLIQMGALDIGGLSLAKLAKQAREDGNMAGAANAERLSKWLIGIMLVGVVTVGLEHALPVALPTWVITCVDVLLVVARSICAVLYGQVVHALKSEAEQEPTHVVKTVDVYTRLDAYIESLRQFGQSVERQFQHTETRIQGVTEALQLTDNRILSVLQLIQASGAETEGRMLGLAEALRSHVDRSLAPIVTELNEQAETLSALSALSAQIGQFEATARVEWQEVKVTVEKHLEVLPKLAEQIVSPAAVTHRIAAPKAITEKRKDRKVRKVKGSVTPAPNTSGEPFDKREFIRECLREDPGVSIGVIQQKALLHGQTIASGYVSEVRKAFVEQRATTEEAQAAEG